MKDESDDQIGMFHKLTNPAFAPEADIARTGALVLAGLLPLFLQGLSFRRPYWSLWYG